jgi:hypothetical protein
MTQVGDRVRLQRCTDQYTRLEPGEEGTVTFIDALGTVSVDWDSGSKLGLVRGEDSWIVLRPDSQESENPSERHITVLFTFVCDDEREEIERDAFDRMIGAIADTQGCDVEIHHDNLLAERSDR